jgi:hypothetical protein
MGVAITCPRCGGTVRAPDLMHSVWRCDVDGAIAPLHVPRNIDAQIVEAARNHLLLARERASDRSRKSGHSGAEIRSVPMWCPWPLPAGWTMNGVGWAGDDRNGFRGTVVACSGPGPVESGPADVLLVAEEPGTGLGARFAGIPGVDPGDLLTGEVRDTAAHARVRADGWPAPLWVVNSPRDRSVYVGEARGIWLYVISWPAPAGFVLAEGLVLHDLVDSVPSGLGFGAPSPYLHGRA